MDDFGIEPPQQARAQQFWEAQEHAAIERLKMHCQGTKRRRQCGVQADRTTGTVGNGGLKQTNFVTADGRADHHRRCGIETATLDQVANGAVDAGTETVIVGAQPDAAQRRGAVHSAAALSLALAPVSASTRLTLCSATK